MDIELTPGIFGLAILVGRLFPNRIDPGHWRTTMWMKRK